MSTVVDLAPANTTPKVYSVDVTAADLNLADYATGLPFFTPNVGDVILAAWMTGAFNVANAFFVGNADTTVTKGATDVYVYDDQVQIVATAQNTELRVYGAAGTAVSGAGTIKVLVLPGS